jgi:hypothetical protein
MVQQHRETLGEPTAGFLHLMTAGIALKVTYRKFRHDSDCEQLMVTG